MTDRAAKDCLDTLPVLKTPTAGFMALLDRSPITMGQRTYILEQVTQFGLVEGARILGNNARDWHYIAIAGAALTDAIRQAAPQSVTSYAEALLSQLNRHTRRFLTRYATQIQAEVDRYRDLEYHMDWVATATHATTYSVIGEQAPYAGMPIETLTYTWVRVAAALSKSLSQFRWLFHEYCHGNITPPSPVMFNAGLVRPSMISCYVTSYKDDMLSLNQVRSNIIMMSKHRGGVGVSLDNIRASGIRGGGRAKGPMVTLRSLNNVPDEVDQGNKRKAAVTAFMSAHNYYADEFVTCTSKRADPTRRIDKLSIGVSLNYAFMKAVKDSESWTLLCPKLAASLKFRYGVDWVQEYQRLLASDEIPRKYQKQIKALDLFEDIIDTQRSSGKPYCINLDAANLKSPFRDSPLPKDKTTCFNLCTEISLPNAKEIASCVLTSINSKAFGLGSLSWEESLVDQISTARLRELVDFQAMAQSARAVVLSLNNLIDVNWFPFLTETERLDQDNNNRKGLIAKRALEDRPLAIGECGFADLLQQLRLPFESPATARLNRMIFACRYFNMIVQSVIMAIEDGPCESFDRTTWAKGLFQFDLWRDESEMLRANEATFGPCERDPAWDEPCDPADWGQKPVVIDLINYRGERVTDVIQPTWADLARVVPKHKLRNTHLSAIPPTATSSIIRSASESTEAYQSNLFCRKTLSGGYTILNSTLYQELRDLGLWTPQTKEYLSANAGDIKGYLDYLRHSQPQLVTPAVERIFPQLERVYKPAWDISQRVMTDLSLQRQRYVDQAVSENIFLGSDFNQRLRNAMLYRLAQGCKTILYYARQPGGRNESFVGDLSVIQYIKERDRQAGEAQKASPPQGWICEDGLCCQG